MAGEDYTLDLEELRHLHTLAKRPRVLSFLTFEIQRLEKVIRNGPPFFSFFFLIFYYDIYVRFFFYFFLLDKIDAYLALIEQCLLCLIGGDVGVISIWLFDLFWLLVDNTLRL